MKFRAESDLVDTLKESIQASFNSAHVRIFQEVSVGYGIADLVVSDLKPSTSNEANHGLTLNHNDINIYTIIHSSKQISLNTILTIVRSSKASVSKSLEKLINRAYVLEVDGLYLSHVEYEPVFRNTFAVEAKLKDWKRALKQAYRYKWFAEYSYVVLDSHYSKSALNNIQAFEKHNVGLASISVDGKLIRHFNPQRQKPLDPKMQILFSEKMKGYELAR